MSDSRASSTASPAFTPAGLLHPSAFPHPVTDLKILETHLSWVILTGPFAYKIKKPVALPFIDCTTLERRRFLCNEELRLNRRLAPDLYVDVVPISCDAGGWHIAGAGEPGEYAVRMKQFDTAQELGTLLDDGTVRTEEILEFAAELARFHGAAPAAATTVDHRYSEQFRSAVLGTIATLLAHLDAPDGLDELGGLIDWIHDAVHDAMPLLQEREERGFIRECHGDLHAHNIVRWKESLVAFDCLEFDAALRWIDVMNDAAFLVMDLRSHARADLAVLFLDRYLEVTGDYAGLRLLPLYAVYRALVRAMVDALGADEHRNGAPDFTLRMKKRISAALKLVNRPPPTLFIMQGTSGSGKSWLSHQLTVPLQAIRVRSDVERQRLGPSPITDRYAPESRRRVYDRLVEHAAACLGGGISVIVDAAFLAREERRPFQRLAERLNVRFVILHCETPPDLQRQRLESRRSTGGDPSEATVDVLQAQTRSADPPDAEESAHWLTAQTDRPDVLERTLRALRAG